MVRTLFVCALLLTLPCTSRAQKSPGSMETRVQLLVQPMAVPRPALKYQLLPELAEMNPGNPIQGYLKCFGEQRGFFFDKNSIKNREKWETMTLTDLPLQELREYGHMPLHQADYAARLDTPDWQVLLQAKREGIAVPLPEVPQLRALASALKVRCRAEVAERRFDDAVRTAKTLFALARHLGEHPTLISNLMGIHIANLALGPLEEMIQQPGCPNLYWALTNLPDPLLSLRKGFQAEELVLQAHFAGIQEGVPMSEAELKENSPLSQVVSRLALIDSFKKEIEVWLEDRVSDNTFVSAARKRLVDAGLPEERVKAFPATQVVWLDDKREYQAGLHDRVKWMGLPYWQAEAGSLASRAAERDNTLYGRFLQETFPEGSDLLKVRKIQTRLEQRIALLRHVEALRLYAAGHDGKLPAALEAVTVPLPVDPFTGKPFVYRLEEETAVLRGGAPKGEEANPVYNLRYRVTIKKAQG